MYFCKPSNEFLHPNKPFADIFPGSLVMSQNLDGVMDGTQNQVKTGLNYRNPTISLYSLIKSSSSKVKYNSGEINKHISNNILDEYQNGNI